MSVLKNAREKFKISRYKLWNTAGIGESSARYFEQETEKTSFAKVKYFLGMKKLLTPKEFLEYWDFIEKSLD